MAGYHHKILHVELDNRSTYIEESDDIFYRLYAGGGLLGTYYLLTLTQPGLDPLSPDNLLIFSNSVIAGYPAAGLVRYIVTAKSPLTDGIGETRCEGSWAVSLKKSGFDAIIFHGESDIPVGLMIDNGQISFFNADRLWGKTVGETNDDLKEKYGRDIDVAAIGPA